MSVVSSRPVVTQVTVIFFYLEESSMVGELCNVCVCSHVPIPGTSDCSKKSFLKLSVFFSLLIIGMEKPCHMVLASSTLLRK